MYFTACSSVTGWGTGLLSSNEAVFFVELVVGPSGLWGSRPGPCGFERGIVGGSFLTSVGRARDIGVRRMGKGVYLGRRGRDGALRTPGD